MGFRYLAVLVHCADPIETGGGGYLDAVGWFPDHRVFYGDCPPVSAVLDG
jgi:hypothetical protein